MTQVGANNKVDCVALGKGGWVIQYSDGRAKWDDRTGIHKDLLTILTNRPNGKFIHLKLSLLKSDVFMCQSADGTWYSQAEHHIEEVVTDMWKEVDDYIATTGLTRGVIWI